jgi:type IV pilus assembly protein PilY1
MTQSTKFLILAAVAGSVLGTARLAKAQADTALPLPNVLLLVDSSGSMEFQSSGDTMPDCDPTDPDASEKSRWTDLVEVLTGAIPDFRCQALDRTTTAFRTEYSLGGRVPYDYGYPKAYHRPMSGECTWGPGNASTTNAYAYLDDAIRFHRYDDASAACSASPPDPRNGLLDGFVHQVRFGLMTFDSLTNAGTGVSGTAANYADGIRGTWSYYPSGTPARGRPLNCTLPMADYEVGARNAAAPPWEGRLIAFGPPPDSSDVSRRNDWIQKTLLAMRPYGATPIAGMLQDAYDFLWNDTSTDPLHTNATYPDFGPRNDAYIAGGCRETHIILLTDGEPNTDLRGDCGTDVPPCPYETPDDIAWSLAHNADPHKDVKVHVIGFALPSTTLADGTPVDCTQLTDAELNDADELCNTHLDEKPLQACCTLHRIALNGNTERALFAGNRAELREAIASILTKLVPNTSRTVPSFSSGAAAFGGAAGFRFLSSFRPTREGVWVGSLERQRFACNDELEPEAQRIDSSKGDDFAANLNSGAGATRVIGTILGETQSGTIRSEASIRPAVTEDDGAGVYSDQPFAPGSPTEWADNTPAAAVIRPGVTECGSTETPQACSTRYLGWTVGLNDGHFDTTGGPEDHRCPVPGETCNLLGSIYHSSPVAVNRPKELLRDETYELFATEKATRPLMLYTSSTDGFFHAFKVAANDPTDALAVDSLENNELWAFVPPAMLPQLPSEYPDATTRLLDAVPVVKDVVATLGEDGRYRFERTATGARTNVSTWRTVLVQGLGLTPGYFALDVTDPESGPAFLWQLSRDADDHPLFGQSSTAPLITTLFFGEGDEEPREVAVAVLPGGPGPVGAGDCPRSTSSPVIDEDFPARERVPCYSDPSALRARSLTIVRLDTGQIVRTFRRAATEITCPATGTCLRDRVIPADLDSPITGQPVAFPGEAGSVADRVFVGDQDGALWRVDLSATSPDGWTMDLFFDAYWGATRPYNAGQPIETQPVLSVNDVGNVTIAFSTGDQDLITSGDQVNYVFSLTEVPQATNPNKTESKVNWYEELSDGSRVTGPISIFASALYFSTYRPVPTGGAVCDTGASCLWGLHYLNAAETSGGENVPASGGAQALPDDLTTGLPSGQKCVPGSDDADALFAQGAVIFGVSVVQLPSCVAEDTPDFTDDFTGQTNATGHRRIESVTPASFQLVMQTGSKGTEVEGGQTKVSSVALPPPNTSPRIDSWAAILD